MYIVLTNSNAFLGLPPRCRPLAPSICVLPLAFAVVEGPLDLQVRRVGPSRCPGLLVTAGSNFWCVYTSTGFSINCAHCWFICNWGTKLTDLRRAAWEP